MVTRMTELRSHKAAAFSFRVRWTEPAGAPLAADATWGELTLLVDDLPVWGSMTKGFLWSWVELLEYLADVWPYLRWDEGFLPGIRPGEARQPSDSAAAWHTPASTAAAWDDEVQGFVDTHDLAQAIAGARLPTLWLVRVGREMVINTESRQWNASAEQTLGQLEALGDEIAARLGSCSDERSRIVLDAWMDREGTSLEAFLDIVTGLDRSAREELQREQSPESYWEVVSLRESPGELLAVARMARTIDVAIVRRILHEVRAVPALSTPGLDALGAGAVHLLGPSDGRPYEQGYAVAGWLRDQLECGSDTSIDPEALLEGWGVVVHTVTLGEPEVDAIAAWGPRHGPCVIVNRSGLHAGGRAGRRASLAHEIAHLLLDRQAALPVAEVLGGAVFRPVEQRAGAFAAEFLLPRAEAGVRFAPDSGPPMDIARQLMHDFGVSQEIVAWQATNSGMTFAPETQHVLKRLRGGSRIA